jgi:hypothetical protein
MKKQEFLLLLKWYGAENAHKALTWFNRNHTVSFKNDVLKQAEFCKDNEYLWR